MFAKFVAEGAACKWHQPAALFNQTNGQCDGWLEQRAGFERGQSLKTQFALEVVGAADMNAPLHKSSWQLAVGSRQKAAFSLPTAYCLLPTEFSGRTTSSPVVESPSKVMIRCCLKVS